VLECDPNEARTRLAEAGVDIDSGNTTHEMWRASHAGTTIVAYAGKVVVQGSSPQRTMALLRDTGGRVHVYFDGACRGNPGPASVGYVIVSGDGIVAEGGHTIGRTTNNQAEYEALVAALEVAVDTGADEVIIRGDSQLVARQVRGEWNTNDPDLRELRVTVHELLTNFSDWSIEHIPREINDRADQLATNALDEN